MIAVLLALALSADPATPVAETASASAAPAPADEKLICKRVDATGAGRTARPKVCLTRAQWRAQDQRGGAKVSKKGGQLAVEKH